MAPKNFEGIPSAERAELERKPELAREWVRTAEDGFYAFNSRLQAALRKLDDEELYLELTAGILQGVNNVAALYRSKLQIDDETWDTAMKDVLEGRPEQDE